MPRLNAPLAALMVLLFADCFAQNTAARGGISGAAAEGVTVALCAEEARDNCVPGVVEAARDGTVSYEVSSMPTFGCGGECFTRNVLVIAADGCRDVEIVDDFTLGDSAVAAVRDIQLDCG